jgi:hypothetical protein
VTRPSSRAFQTFLRLQSSLPDSSPIAFRSHAWEILQHLYLPRARSIHDIDHTTASCYSWVYAVCHLNMRSVVMDRSLLAFCAIQVHISEPWSISRQYALELYSKALEKLVQSLDLLHERGQDETLAAIVVLSTCEVQPCLALSTAPTYTDIFGI